MPVIAPPPVLQPTNTTDTEEAARMAAASRMGVDQTILGGAQGGPASGKKPATLLSGTA